MGNYDEVTGTLSLVGLVILLVFAGAFFGWAVTFRRTDNAYFHLKERCSGTVVVVEKAPSWSIDFECRN